MLLLQLMLPLNKRAPIIKGAYFCFFLFIPYLFICSCKEPDHDILTKNTDSYRKMVNYSIEDFKLIGDSLTQVYYQKTHLYEDEGEEILYGYNHSLHAFDVFSLNEGEYEKRIFLDQDGPDAINRVFKFTVLSKDSIVIMDALKLWLLDGTGKVLKKYSTVVNDSDELRGHFLNYNDANLGYIKEENSILMHFVHEDEGASKFDPKSIFPIVGKLDLMNGKISFLPVPYPTFVQENYDKISEKMPNLSYHNNKVFYGFPGHSNIYTYSFSEKDFGIFGGKSKFSNNEEDYVLSNEFGFRLVGTWFNSVHYESMNKVYLRTHWGSQEPYQANGDLSDGFTKPGYLMVFDDEIRFIDEIKIPNDYWLEDSFIAKDGIYFWKKDIYLNKEDGLILGRLKILID